jgi:hypothetical protein
MLWIIFAIVVGLALVLWFFVFRKNSGPLAPRAEVNKTIVAAQRIQAPGIDPTTGDPPNAPPQPPAPPPVPGAPAPTRPAVINVARAVRPSAVMQHIPVIGPAIVSTTLKPAQLANSAFTKVNDVAAKSLEHIPVVGSTLAAPAKAVSSVAKSLTSWL